MSRVAVSGTAYRLRYNAQTSYTMLHVRTLYLSHAVVTDFHLSLNLIVRFKNIRFIYYDVRFLSFLILSLADPRNSVSVPVRLLTA